MRATALPSPDLARRAVARVVGAKTVAAALRDLATDLASERDLIDLDALEMRATYRETP